MSLLSRPACPKSLTALALPMHIVPRSTQNAQITFMEGWLRDNNHPTYEEASCVHAEA